MGHSRLMTVRRIVGLIAVLALVSLQRVPVSAAGPPIVLSAILSTTGQFGFVGSAEQHFLEALEKRLNAEGGIHGRPVHFQVFDDGSSPQVAVQLANQIIATGVSVFLGPGSAATCDAVAPLTKSGPTNYCFSPAFHPPAGAFSFSAGASSQDNETAMVRYFRERGWKRLAMITSSDASGQDGERWIKLALGLPENKDVQIVDLQHCSPGDISVAAQMAHMKQTNPQGLLAWTGGTLFVTVVRGYTDSGMDVPIGTTAANMSYPAMKALAGLNNRDLYFPGSRYFEVGTLRKGPLKDRVEQFYQSIGEMGLKMDATAGDSWDPALIVVTALRTLGLNASAIQIRDYILNLRSFVGISGVYNFSDGSQRGINSASVTIMRWEPQSETWIPVSTAGGAARAPR